MVFCNPHMISVCHSFQIQKINTHWTNLPSLPKYSAVLRTATVFLMSEFFNYHSPRTGHNTWKTYYFLMVSRGSGHSGGVLFNRILDSISGADTLSVMDIKQYRSRCYLSFLWTLLVIKGIFFFLIKKTLQSKLPKFVVLYTIHLLYFLLQVFWFSVNK